jgi:hypothetical protein
MSDEPMPTTIKELWNTGWVAENEEEAIAQARRMFDLFQGKEVEVDRLTLPVGDDYIEEMFVEPWPRVYVEDLNVEGGWDGDGLYPEWDVRVVDPDQIVTTHEGKVYRMGDIAPEADACPLTSTLPGIGTAAGFFHNYRLIYPTSWEVTP